MNLEKEIARYYYSSALCDLKLMNEKIIEGGISYNSLLYLELIFCMDGKCSVSDIAKLLNISKPAVSLKINELIKQGLVTKKTDPKDKRRNFLYVNDKSMPKYKIYRTQDNLAIKTIKENYTKEEIDKFCEMFSILTEVNLRDTELDNFRQSLKEGNC